MPSAATPQRRPRDEESSEESQESLPENAPHISKKSRRDTRSAPSVPRSVLPKSYRSQRQADSQVESSVSQAATMTHQPGSIIRVKLSNFVTYTAVEFFPGPSLNMVIGPNGTGKSTLVCAICLGLGWGPQHLGRAKQVSEFVKFGCQESTIEIELAGDPARNRGRNPVFKCIIKREGNSCHYSLNGKPANRKQAMELARLYSIQIDNLCQFLPQDKVVEFAAMNPVELLRSTQRAVASQEMIDWHEELKALRVKQRTIEIDNAADLETLANLEGRQRMQEADVERMREREEVKERIRCLEATKPFAEYRAARAQFETVRQQRRETQAELLQLKKEIDPSLRAVEVKKAYQGAVKTVVEERKHIVTKAEKYAVKFSDKATSIQDKVQQVENEKEAERKGNQKNKNELKRLESIIDRLKKQMEDPPIEFDVAASNLQIRDRERQIQDLREQAQGHKENNAVLERRIQSKRMDVSQAERDIQNLESQAGQQSNKLRRIGLDSFRAWEWIQKHQDDFEMQVFGPPIVECSVKDSRYVDMIEGLFGHGDYIAFTVQTKNDFEKLSRQLYEVMNLVQINIRTMTGSLQNFHPPVGEQDMKRFGLDGWALDYVNGPEKVLAMLCSEGPRLHATGVAIQDTTEEQYELLSQSTISVWITSKSIYKISRRREYGPGATSTTVRGYGKAQIWTDQPVDMTAKREIQQRISAGQAEITECSEQIQGLKTQVAKLRDRAGQLAEEQKSIQEDKQQKQKAISEFNALPIRLAQQEEKAAVIRTEVTGVKDRLLGLEDKHDDFVLEKAQAALEYAKAVENLRKAHVSLQEAEISLLEASSDLEALIERNKAVVVQLSTKEREVEEIIRASQALLAERNACYQRCQAILANADPRLKEFIGDVSAEQSVEELETDIESEKARLELMHEGNGSIIKEFELRRKRIEQLQAKLESIDGSLAEIGKTIADIRQQWEPKLDRLIKRISHSFAYNMEQIHCAGGVSVYKDDQDFNQWAIQIHVKFRDTEPLTLLDSHRQSGGERAVSTIFYLMSLQSLTRSPFRVVDEINQGMDPRNERLVHARMVSIATGNDDWQPPADLGGSAEAGGEGGEEERVVVGSQYFLITPKLLHGLRYERGMKVLCIASGEYMPEDQLEVDFGRSLVIRRGLGVVGAVGG